MYHMKPIIDSSTFIFDEIHSMYKMKPIESPFVQDEGTIDCKPKKVGLGLPKLSEMKDIVNENEMKELEKRWHNIESKLLLIKSEVDDIKAETPSQVSTSNMKDIVNENEMKELEKRWHNIESKLLLIKSEVDDIKAEPPSQVSTSNMKDIVNENEMKELEKRWHNIESKLLLIKSEVDDIKAEPPSQVSTSNMVMESEFISEDLLEFHEEILRRVTQLQSTLQGLQRSHAVFGTDTKEMPLIDEIILRQQASLLELIASLNRDIIRLCIAPQKVYDLVVQASPSAPPFFLKFFKAILEQSGVRVLAKTHCHSSVSVTKDQETFLESSSSFERSSVHVILTLIWTNVEHGPVLRVGASSKVPIVGDGNIARFFGRLFPKQIAYENLSVKETTQIDHFLDFAHETLLNGNKKDIVANLNMLDAILSSEKYLCGSSITIADVVVWSAVSQVADLNSLPKSLKNWYDYIGHLTGTPKL
ncbi:aminoacyl tRNA synthase complex-interacting multifunctional protein 2-like isoform X2 [Artemia franciscana]|uniref:aminoacyl tRNA synthase complex-interacting multifunctional protein 2-like isoform X2 n=1 Tax=Artemia franciscana TaxID=6661 RepID=UPI0032DA2D74